MSNQVQANYDRLSRWYDLFAGSEKKFTQAGVNLLDVQPGERVLEIGCGTGHALKWLKQAADPGLIVGADLSSGMLGRAKKNLSAITIPLIQTNALTLPCSAGSFNVIFMSFTLELFPATKIRQLLAECQRVLKSDGRLGVVCMAEENGILVQLYKGGHKRWPNVLDCRPISAQDHFAESGFEPITIHRQTMWGLPVDIVIARQFT